MKKTNNVLITLICFVGLFSVSNANAQITFEHSYGSSPGDNVPVHVTTLENSGDKYVVYDELLATLYLYNLNHSLWKTIIIDTVALGLSPNYTQFAEGIFVSYIKENLFDLDSQIEFVWQYSQFNLNPQIISAIIDESGLPVAVFDSCYIMGDLEGYYQGIRNTSTGTKLITVNGFTDEYKVYSLPGTLTCNPCGGVSGIVNPSNNAGRMPSKAFPVPAEKSITIQYELPKGSKSGTIEIHKVSGEQIESISIGPAFTDITVPVSIYSGGVYLYTVKTSDGSIVSTGKFIVN
jgi:hypothetical protein